MGRRLLDGGFGVIMADMQNGPNDREMNQERIPASAGSREAEASRLSRRQWAAVATAAVAALGQGELASAAPKTPKVGGKVLNDRPESYEMGLEGFQQWITPTERFFVRSHHYTPEIQLAEWKLKVDGRVATPLQLTMEELKQLPKVTLVSVLECAGNGRGLYEPSMPGLQWEYGSVGNARWAGVRLADVLKKAGVDPAAVEVVFDGADVPVGTMPEFQRALPVKKAMDPNVLLAYEMNGEALPVSHGFPLRVVVPGWAGDIWVKWLTGIQVVDKPFEGFFMKTAYRHPGRPVRPGTAVDPAQMQPVTRLSIKSILTSHQDNQDVAYGPVTLTGAAWSNESPLTSVEISVDGGRTWAPARLGKEMDRFAWRLWSYAWTPKQPGYYNVMVRARNAMGEAQPFAQEWNPSGYGHNVVQNVRLHLTAQPTAKGGSNGWPTAEGAPAVYQQSCLGCHGDESIQQQRLTRGQWEREVEKMVRWGAQVKPEQKDTLLDFLAKRFGPRAR